MCYGPGPDIGEHHHGELEVCDPSTRNRGGAATRQDRQGARTGLPDGVPDLEPAPAGHQAMARSDVLSRRTGRRQALQCCHSRGSVHCQTRRDPNLLDRHDGVGVLAASAEKGRGTEFSGVRPFPAGSGRIPLAKPTATTAGSSALTLSEMLAAHDDRSIARLFSVP